MSTKEFFTANSVLFKIMPIKSFCYHGNNLAVEFIETTKVAEGIECDVYRFVAKSFKRRQNN